MGRLDGKREGSLARHAGHPHVLRIVEDMMSDQAAGWGEYEDNARRVRREFWAKVKRVGARLPFAEDLLAAYFCAFDRETPRRVHVGLVAALAYFVVPLDFVPDVLPLFGFADDAAVLAAAIKLVADHIRPYHREAAKQALARDFAPT
jgi:uncharacterized membrane protein YkvA (DUF1232 family)